MLWVARIVLVATAGIDLSTNMLAENVISLGLIHLVLFAQQISYLVIRLCDEKNKSNRIKQLKTELEAAWSHQQAELERQVEERTLELKKANVRLEQLATTDTLTGLPNRRSIDQSLSGLFEQFKQHHQVYSVMMIDIDHFKTINDTYGHAIGDEVLRRVATVIRDAVRPDDVAGRIGGEEFLAVLPDLPAEPSSAIAEHIRFAVQSAVMPSNMTVTVSIGVAQVAPADLTYEDAIRRADKKLYAAKASGRNRVFAVVN